MKRWTKKIILFIVTILILAIVVFKYGIKITTYNKTGFIVTTEECTEDELEKSREYYWAKDFENLKKLDYECTKFFDFPKKDVICEYIYMNTTVIYEGQNAERNIYAVLCNDKTIKYIRGSIGKIESIEDRYNFDESKKYSWLYYYSKDEYDMKLTNAQYNKIINLLKLLKLFHNKDNIYNLWESHDEDINVFYLEGEYYNFENDDRFISSIIEDSLEKYIREIIYENSGFDWDEYPDWEADWDSIEWATHSN